MTLYTPPKRRSGLSSFFYGLWTVIDTSRKVVLNILFLLIAGILVGSCFFGGGGPKIKDKTALVLDFKGTIVEQRSGSPRERIMNQAQGQNDSQVQLRDIFAVLEAAAKDPKIDRAVLILDEFSGAGLATLREIAGALERFKASGKQVVAWGSSYDQRSYYLAAHANEVYVHPMGMVMIEGFGGYRNYYKDALDRIGVTVNVIRVGTYKSFGEPYFANAPSTATTEADKYLYDAMWKTYTDGIEKARKLGPGDIAKGIDELPQRFAAVNGDAAKLALESKLVDGLKTRDEIRALLSERGAKDEVNKSFRQVSFDTYRSTLKPTLFGDSVGVIIAEGEISDGTAPAGRIGGRSTAELVRKARDDEKIKAIVLRVDSPGGSAFGSELIRRELELTRAAGKPVVISMGDVAASGGYWVAMAADEIIAEEATITGSIGVFGILPTGEKAMEKLSINTAGYTTTWFAKAYDPRRALDPRFAAMVQASIGNIYSDFITKAAAARKSTTEKIDAAAQGRVWTGAQALERGLIDRTGSFADAIKSAATRGKLTEAPRVTYIEQEPTRLEQLIEGFAGSTIKVMAEKLDIRMMPAGVPANAAREVQEDLTWLTDTMNRPGNSSALPYAVVTHCLCGR